MKTFILIAIASCAWLATSFAATIPAGTPLTVRTLTPIHSNDAIGKTFTAQLDQDIVVKGNIVARTGTKFLGKVESSTKIGSAPLTVNLTGVDRDGKSIPIHTASAFEPKSLARGRRGKVSASRFVLPTGSKLEFRLAEPLTL